MSAAGAVEGRVVSRRSARPSTFAIYAWELRKLRVQKRTYLGLILGALMPLIFVVSQNVRSHHGGGGQGSLFESQITQSGLATPVLMLLWMSLFLLPLIATLVAGDIVANEDGNGTLKTILTRSVDRGQVFAAKALAAATYAVSIAQLFPTANPVTFVTQTGDPRLRIGAIAVGPLSDYIWFRRCRIRFSTQIKPISFIKAHAAEVLDQLQHDREPIVITQNGEARAVLIDVHTYEQSQETLALLQILAHGKKQVETGRTLPLSEAVDKLRSSLRPGQASGKREESQKA